MNVGHYFLFFEPLADDLQTNFGLWHRENVRIFLDEKLRVFKLQRCDADNLRVSDDVCRVVFTADSDFNDRDVDVLFDENIKRHNLKELEVAWKIEVVVLFGLKSVEHLPEVVGKQLLADGTAAQFDSLRHGNEMRRCKQSGRDVVLAENCVSECAHGALALAASDMNH